MCILLLKCHSAMLHHADLSKHFCCNGLCRAVAHLSITEMSGERIFPFFFPTQKVEGSYKMSDLMKLMGQEAGLCLPPSNTDAYWSSLLLITQTAETCIFPDRFRPLLYYTPYHQWKDIDLVLRKYKKNYRKISSHHKHPDSRCKWQIAEGKNKIK